MKNKKNLIWGISALLIINCILLLKNCNQKQLIEVKDKKIDKTIDKKVLFTGEFNDVGSPINFWDFYGDNGESILSLIFYKNDKNEFDYEIKQKNSLGKIVYSAEMRNGKVLKEFDYEILQNINIDNGRFMYENYCVNCHNYKKEGVSKPLLKLKNIEVSKFIKKYKNVSHENVPKLNDNELKSVILFINK
ncbi:cytochrome c [Flavobacterium johnsoniae]|jgi:hypothetical protein|uniref:Hypothetical lipoprotein n=1 Tax=Flavobacterium johnsoniae (strain ATCC 17061 / DSM 2064 / JCM 8514 / BCRC 14874 / CCUG 350202 / NBRC 14942 / NCIMB 11054 / UW101) TaxID=376686 RepID=A5FMC1_FLAJ1|nr:cytochrome c [Flavobacterium johnsoniae]ABQ03642.1 hypothetical lipoprotein [Flavobacterium johnsoniae UW101]OXE95059.1 hypothetical protein B0A63_25790 [Flavobacterium johnsoniae UW101]WQG79494.1 cytochrome c [Flavobacterium johnsoniae UW101]SHJ98556.1 hypothetical protein SAMN05444146_0002 [Flavobacterium johnsoniae]